MAQIEPDYKNQGNHPEQDPYAAKIASPLYRFFDRIFFLIQLHAAILLGTAAGLVVFGFFPSLFAAARLSDDSLENREGRVFSSFFRIWKKEFRSANGFAALVIVSSAALFGIWYLLWYVRQPILATVANALFLLGALALLLLILYVPVLRLYYGWMKKPRLILFAVLFGLGHFATTLLLLGITAAWIFFAGIFPQFAVFLLFSVIPWSAVVLTRRLIPGMDRAAAKGDSPRPADQVQ